MSGQLDNFWACPHPSCGGSHNPFFKASPTGPTLTGLTPHSAPKSTPRGPFGAQRYQKDVQMGHKMEAQTLQK